jgi:hypothetical protein
MDAAAEILLMEPTGSPCVGDRFPDTWEASSFGPPELGPDIVASHAGKCESGFLLDLIDRGGDDAMSGF